MEHNNNLDTTRTDLRHDLVELGFLAEDLLSKLDFVRKQLPSRFLRKEAAEYLLKHIKSTLVAITQLNHSISTLNKTLSQVSVNKAIAQKYCFYEQLRTLNSTVASFATATNWQSPSYAHSVYPQAGLKTGKIIGNITDYTRDQHLEANTYQQLFAKEYIGSRNLIPLEIFVTQSGMAALSTIIMFLKREKKDNGPILMGKSSYFQNKELIAHVFNQPVVEVDEHDTKGIEKAIKKHSPAVIFFDSLCNAPDLALPNLNHINKYLIKTATRETYIIIDNTCLALGYAPLRNLPFLSKKVKLMVFESLNKHFQFGLDRTTGGFVYGLPQDAAALFYSRVHAGTIMTDTSVAMLPTPNRKLLEKRLSRLKRNADYVATTLDSYIQNHTTNVERIIYPGLPHHPAYDWAKKLAFHGACITLAFSHKKSSVKHYKGFIKKIIRNAQRQHIPLVAGTSFGMNVSRVYLTSLRSDYGTPFIRIAVGTETWDEIVKLTQLIASCLT